MHPRFSPTCICAVGYCIQSYWLLGVQDTFSYLSGQGYHYLKSVGNGWMDLSWLWASLIYAENDKEKVRNRLSIIVVILVTVLSYELYLLFSGSCHK